MRIKFKTESFDTEYKKMYYVEHCISVEEVKSIYGFPESVGITLKNGKELYADSEIEFID